MGPDNPGRADRAVIMARGLGLRMGGPKGLLRFSPAGPAFVRTIAELYLARGIPVEVVTLEASGEALRQELPPRDDCRILAADQGGDTARTLLLSWRRFRDENGPCSHIWAHPVDLPLVTGETLDLLAGCSRRQPDRIIRPERAGTPGHPVILPYDVLAELERRPSFHGGPLRDFISRGVSGGWLAHPLGVTVEDEGVDRDFDRPEDLPKGPAGGPGKEERHE